MDVFCITLQPRSVQKDVFTALLDGALSRRRWVTLKECLNEMKQHPLGVPHLRHFRIVESERREPMWYKGQSTGWGMGGLGFKSPQP